MRRMRRFLANSQLHLRRYCNAASASASAEAAAGGVEEDALSREFGGVSKAFVKRHFPALLQPEVQHRLRPLFTHLRSFGVDDKALKSLLKKNSSALSAAAPDLAPNIAFLRRHGLDDAQIAHSIAKHPAIAIASVDNVLLPRLALLQRHAALSPPAISALLAACPAIVASSDSFSESDLTARIAFLGRHGMSREGGQLDACVRLHPQVLGYELGSRIKPVVRVLTATLPADIVRAVLQQQPQVLGRSPESVSELLSAFKYIGYRSEAEVWCQSLGWGCLHGVEAVRDKIDFLMSMDMAYKHAVLLLKAEPHIFKVDDRVLKEKLDFFFKEMRLGVGDLIKFPSYLSRKLMDRVRIRWQVLSLLKSRGIIKTVFVQDLVTLPNKWFVETFVFKYPDCGRIYYGARSALKQARAQHAATSSYL